MIATAVVLGSTTNFDLPQEEVEAFQADHSQNGGSAGPSNEEDDEDESLVYVPSPKVPHSYCFCERQIHAHAYRHGLWEALNEPTAPWEGGVGGGGAVALVQAGIAEADYLHEHTNSQCLCCLHASTCSSKQCALSMPPRSRCQICAQCSCATAVLH